MTAPRHDLKILGDPDYGNRYRIFDLASGRFYAGLFGDEVLWNEDAKKAVRFDKVVWAERMALQILGA